MIVEHLPNFVLYCLQTKSDESNSNVTIDGEIKQTAEPKTEAGVKEAEEKLHVTCELKRLQFVGAGPKVAVPDITNIGSDHCDLTVEKNFRAVMTTAKKFGFQCDQIWIFLIITFGMYMSS